MTTSRQKGSRYELRSVEYLKKMGYSCYRCPQKVAWIGKGRAISINADAFGIIDVIGIKRTSVCFVQVKFLGENGTHVSSETRRKLAALPAPPNSVYLHIWRKGARAPEVEGF